MNKKYQNEPSASSLRGFSPDWMHKANLASVASNPRVMAPIIFVATILILGLVGIGSAFVREDVMIINLFNSYGPGSFVDVFLDGWHGLFGGDFTWINWSYRPLEWIVDVIVLKLFGESEFLLILFKSAITALSAVLVYFLGLELTRKPWVAIASAMFFVFSIPVIIESWWFHHVVGYAGVVILLGFLGYLRYLRTKRLRWLVVFWLSALIGPWLAEYAVIVAVVALLHLIIEKWDWKLLISLPLLIFHGFYSAFLPNLIIAQEIVLEGVFSSSQVGAATSGGLLSVVQPGAPYLLILGTLTPILTLVAFISLLVHFFSKRKEYPNFVMMGIPLLIILAIIFISGYPPPSMPWGDLPSRPYETGFLLAALFPVGFAILSFPLNKFLCLWFMASYIPLIVIPHLSVNLVPAMIPWTIILVLWIARLAERVNLGSITNLSNIKGIFKTSLSMKRSLVVLPITIILVVGVAAQVSNIAITKETWGKMATNTQEMGNYAAENMAEGSIILGEQNSLFEAVDMSYYSDGKVKGNILVYRQYMLYPLQQIRTDEFGEFLADNTSFTEKYFLIQEQIHQPLYEHQRLNPDEFQLVAQFDVKSRILLIDPLYLILPRDVPYFMGFNIVRIYPSGGGPFYAEFTGPYAIYKYIGR
jgi:hypothetical protein